MYRVNGSIIGAQRGDLGAAINGAARGVDISAGVDQASGWA